MTSEIIPLDQRELEARLDEGFSALDREHWLSVSGLRERVFQDLRVYFSKCERGNFSANRRYVEMTELYGCK